MHCSKLLYMFEYFFIFSYFSDNLSSLVESQPRSKKSRRCVLHSLDSQRSRAVVTDQWRDAWDRMKPLCKDEVLLIEASALLSTLNNYLHKHRYEQAVNTSSRTSSSYVCYHMILFQVLWRVPY